MQLSIVIPVHNEEANIGSLLTEIDHCMDGKYDYETICVDDCSTDATVRVITNHIAVSPSTRLLRHSHRRGQSWALHTGVRAARHALIVTLDGDGQNDPADIASFVRTYEQHYPASPCCLLIGHRQKRRDSVWKRQTSRLANAVRRLALADDTPDSGCGIKAFDREVFLGLPAFDHMHRFLPALIRQQRGMVFSLAVNHRPRLGGRSHYGTLDRLFVGIMDILGVMWLRRRALPVANPKYNQRESDE